MLRLKISQDKTKILPIILRICIKKKCAVKTKNGKVNDSNSLIYIKKVYKKITIKIHFMYVYVTFEEKKFNCYKNIRRRK